MANLALTQNKIALVDDTDFEYLNQWKWFYSGGYAYRKEYPKGMKGVAFNVLMHRFIMDCPEGLQVDHANRDTLDNRRINLRVATKSQNQWNRGVGKNNKSGHKGVSWDKKNNKWRVSVNVNYEYFNLGRFSSLEEAVRAHTEFITEKHGEFARQG